VSGAGRTSPRRAGVPQRRQYRLLQALEDALNYRLARLAGPCAECGPFPAGARCVEHACDLALVAGYRDEAAAVMAGLARRNQALRRGGVPRIGEHE
jgi:hypothetical protein